MRARPIVTLRPAIAADRVSLWRWRNDPDTRQASFDQAEIRLEEHTRWFEASLARSDRQIYVVQADGADAGSVRLVLDGREAVVSIAIAPEWRGKGVGPAALRAVAVEAFGRLGLDRLVARVKRENAASWKAFERGGFRLADGGEVATLELRARPRVVAAIQARMGSTRLPGKVLRVIAGKPMIGWMAERLRLCREVNEVVVSTTTAEPDRTVVEFAERAGLRWVCGSEQDLIQRLLLTARTCAADAVVRVTGDCPFVDPAVVDRLVRVYRENVAAVDFVTNNDPPSFPLGLDAEVITTATLERLDREVRGPYHREWIPFYVKAHRERFRIVNVSHSQELFRHRWTVDYAEDLEFAARIFEALGPDPSFRMEEVLEFLSAHPEVAEINAMHVPAGLAAAREGTRP